MAQRLQLRLANRKRVRRRVDGSETGSEGLLCSLTSQKLFSFFSALFGACEARRAVMVEFVFCCELPPF